MLYPGSTFGQYRIVRRIGSGGMGAVFEGVHELLSRRVAIKVMHGRSAEKADSRERFLREARAVAKIRHPYVVDVFDVGMVDEQPFMVMEFLEGESLEATLARVGRLDAANAVSVLLPIAAALATVHKHGLVHRDVKPENVFLARDARGQIVPKLVDFGIAKDLTLAVMGEHHTIVGTPHFMSPEQTRGSLALDGRTDEYSFGVLAYEMLTGRMPFEADSLFELVRAIDRGEVTPMRAIDPSIDARLEAVILRAMARDAEQRYPTMRELGRALLPFATESLAASVANDFGTTGAATTPLEPVSGVITRPRPPETTLDRIVRDDESVPIGVPIHDREFLDRSHGVADAPTNRLAAALVGLIAIVAVTVGMIITFARESSAPTVTPSASGGTRPASATIASPAPVDTPSPTSPPAESIGVATVAPTQAEPMLPPTNEAQADETPTPTRPRRAASRTSPRDTSDSAMRTSPPSVEIRLER